MVSPARLTYDVKDRLPNLVVRVFHFCQKGFQRSTVRFARKFPQFGDTTGHGSFVLLLPSLSFLFFGMGVSLLDAGVYQRLSRPQCRLFRAIEFPFRFRFRNLNSFD
jgi:hypothetical protein